MCDPRFCCDSVQALRAFGVLIFLLHVADFQVMNHAKDMLASAYEKDRYKGHGIKIYKVPNNTTVTGYDCYPEDQSNYEREMLSKPRSGMSVELLKEFRQLMRHQRSSRFRVEFVRCKDPSCPICSRRVKKCSEVDKVFDRFPAGMLPTPVPVLRDGGEYEILSTLMQSIPDDQGAGSDADTASCAGNRGAWPQELQDFATANTGRYRNFAELVKTSLPDGVLFPDSHYSGKSAQHRCPDCGSWTVLKSESALQRHRKLVHTMEVD